MPYFKTYKNDKGNYIHANPPDTGNITYQTTPEAEDFIKQLEYTDGDKLPWGIINPLRAAGLIYTHGQGTGTIPDDTPELDRSELATMSADEAEKLLSYLQSRGDVPDEIYDQLREIVEESEKDDTEVFSLDDALDEIGKSGEDDIEKLPDALEPQTPPSMSVSGQKPESNDDYDYEVMISVRNSVDYRVEHCVHYIGILIESPHDEYDHRIMEWNVGLPTTT
ncbi:hypothetical protein, partial [Haloquadratum walsbyi]